MIKNDPDKASVIPPHSNRTIDDVIRYVESRPSYMMSPTIRRVLANRLNVPPTQEELDRAKKELYG